ARDAMPEGGRVTIRTANVSRGSAPADLASGDYVRVSVSDTGQGMSKEVLSKAVEPFFTTKEPGKGSGLGLSLVHGVATQSGGCARSVGAQRHGRPAARGYGDARDERGRADQAGTRALRRSEGNAGDRLRRRCCLCACRG